MNVSPTLRAFGILVLIAAVITALQLGFGLVVILTFLQVLFLVAIAYVLIVLWRRNRESIAMWSLRSRLVFYGGAALAITAVVLALTPWFPTSGLDTVAAVLAVAAGVFGMWRTWRNEHTYGDDRPAPRPPCRADGGCRRSGTCRAGGNGRANDSPGSSLAVSSSPSKRIVWVKLSPFSQVTSAPGSTSITGGSKR